MAKSLRKSYELSTMQFTSRCHRAQVHECKITGHYPRQCSHVQHWTCDPTESLSRVIARKMFFLHACATRFEPNTTSCSAVHLCSVCYEETHRRKAQCKEGQQQETGKAHTTKQNQPSNAGHRVITHASTPSNSPKRASTESKRQNPAQQSRTSRDIPD